MATHIRITDNKVEVVFTGTNLTYETNPPEDMSVIERVQLLARNLPGHTASVWNRESKIIVEAKSDKFSTMMIGVILARAVHGSFTITALIDHVEADGE